ncbi:MAG: efflux RND transporter periplasmic adaptor subunit, partial [Clostridiales bacterium]|nr:efflux RND transporter periplasmic adaptor subunit [Clostridiales bacterium]
PSDAVIIKNGTSMVATLHEDTAVFKKVTVGIDNTKNVEIIDGLQEGDTIITEGQYYLDDGSKVNVIQ